MRKLLVHTCCAPCFSYIEKDLRENGIINKNGDAEKVEYTALWYNSNIHPKVEYERRKNTFIDFCENIVNCKYDIIDEYDLNSYIKYVVENVGQDKEYKIRCEYCYYMRLKKVFEYAKTNGFDIVTTTLTISPYQNHDLIIKVLERLEKEYGIEGIYIDYREHFREGQKMAREYGLYMQKYCGCVFSFDSRKVGILMKKYSKSGLRTKRNLKVLISIFVIIIIICSAFLVYLHVKNNIIIEKIDTNSSFVNDDIAKNSNPIVIDNIILGAIYDKTWVSSERYYMMSKNKSNVSIDTYNKKGKAGNYTLNSLSKTDATIYAETTNTNFIDEYIAINKTSNNIMINPATKITNITEKDVNIVKKSLGIYKLLNSSVKVTEVYDIALRPGEAYSRFIFATSEKNKSTGIYSAVIYVNPQGKASLIKYSYIKDINNSSEWPTYSFKFNADLNQDGTNELIIQETREFSVKYDVLELRKNNFYEVLSVSMKI